MPLVLSVRAVKFQGIHASARACTWRSCKSTLFRGGPVAGTPCAVRRSQATFPDGWSCGLRRQAHRHRLSAPRPNPNVAIRSDGSWEGGDGGKLPGRHRAGRPRRSRESKRAGLSSHWQRAQRCPCTGRDSHSDARSCRHHRGKGRPHGPRRSQHNWSRRPQPTRGPCARTRRGKEPTGTQPRPPAGARALGLLGHGCWA